MTSTRSLTLLAWVFACFLGAVSPARAAEPDTTDARKAIVRRILNNQVFQEAMRPSLLDAVRSTVERDRSEDPKSIQTTVVVVFEMAMMKSFAEQFTVEELLALEPIYTSRAGLSAIAKTREAYGSFIVEFKRAWSVYGK